MQMELRVFYTISLRIIGLLNLTSITGTIVDQTTLLRSRS